MEPLWNTYNLGEIAVYKKWLANEAQFARINDLEHPQNTEFGVLSKGHQDVELNEGPKHTYFCPHFGS